MTTPHDPPDRPDRVRGDLPELTEPEEREVSALLADVAAAPQTAPPEVVARLDEALAALVSERASGSHTVVPLASRTVRRRRRLTRTLLAAATVAVGGYAVGNLASSGTLAGGETATSDAGGSAAGDAGDAQVERAAPGPAQMSLVPTVRRDHLAADVRRVVRLFEQGSAADDPRGDVVDTTRDCPVPLTGDQRLYQVRFRGDPAGLVVGPGRQQRVDVAIYSCLDGGIRLARTLPAP